MQKLKDRFRFITLEDEETLQIRVGGTPNELKSGQSVGRLLPIEGPGHMYRANDKLARYVAAIGAGRTKLTDREAETVEAVLSIQATDIAWQMILDSVFWRGRLAVMMNY